MGRPGPAFQLLRASLPGAWWEDTVDTVEGLKELAPNLMGSRHETNSSEKRIEKDNKFDQHAS